MAGKLIKISNTAEVLGPRGWTTLTAISNTALSGIVSQTPGILSHVITEQKRPIFLVLVTTNVSVQDLPNIQKPVHAYVDIVVLTTCSIVFQFI